MTPEEIDARLARDLRALHASLRPDLAGRLADALRDALAVLEAVPRDDPFWSPHANDRATSFKLLEHVHLRLQHDPADDAARWAVIAFGVSFGGNDGGLDALAPLLARDPGLVDDAVALAGFVWGATGVNPTTALRSAVARADRAALEQCAHSPRGDAARLALQVLDGEDLSHLF